MMAFSRVIHSRGQVERVGRRRGGRRLGPPSGEHEGLQGRHRSHRQVHPQVELAASIRDGALNVLLHHPVAPRRSPAPALAAEAQDRKR